MLNTQGLEPRAWPTLNSGAWGRGGGAAALWRLALYFPSTVPNSVAYVCDRATRVTRGWGFKIFIGVAWATQHHNLMEWSQSSRDLVAI